MKKALMVSAKANMIQQFNKSNIIMLQELGYDVTVATNFKEPGTIPVKKSKELYNNLMSMDVDPINVCFRRSPIDKSNIKAYKHLKKIISDGNFDLIHCHSPIGGALTRLAAKNARLEGTRVLYTAHGFHFYDGAPLKNWLFLYPVERFFSRFTDVLITINEEDYNRARTFKAKQVKSIPGVGIDLQKFIPQTKEKKQLLRKEYKIVQNDFILLYVAELSDRKNQMILLKSMKKIEKTHPNIKLLLAGQGENRQLYEKYLEENNLKNVSILGFRNDVENLMQLSDVAVSSSKQEGLPVNILEAMATGLPVIASDVRGNRDLIDDKKGGLLFSPNDANQLSECIIKMLNNDSFRKSASIYNVEKVKQFSLINVQNEMAKIY